MVTNGFHGHLVEKLFIWSLMGFDGHLVETLLYGH